MKILDVLAKLGILRFGAKAGTYTNAAERPAELMMDDVYNAERDLVASDEKKAARKASAGKTPDARPI